MPIKSKLLLKLLNIMVILLFTFGTFTFNAFAARKNQCLKCHKHVGMHAKNIRASSKRGCGACHLAVQGKKHPQQKNSIKLKYDIPGLCYDCHRESQFKGHYIHVPVAEGKCTVCHNIHKSRVKSLLASETPELCYQCHDKAKFTKKYIHKVALNSCGRRCHNPHASENPYLLALSINDNCAGCHKAQETGRHIVSIRGGGIHPIRGVPYPKKPTKEMGCTSCHSPHSSNFVKLFLSKKKCKRCHRNY